MLLTSGLWFRDDAIFGSPPENLKPKLSPTPFSIRPAGIHDTIIHVGFRAKSSTCSPHRRRKTPNPRERHNFRVWPRWVLPPAAAAWSAERRPAPLLHFSTRGRLGFSRLKRSTASRCCVRITTRLSVFMTMTTVGHVTILFSSCCHGDMKAD